MDNQQLPQQPLNGSETGPALLCLTDEQRRILNGILEQAVSQLVSIQFNEPDKDALKLRQHSYCYGAVDSVQSILKFDEKALTEFEEKMRHPDPQFSANF